MHIPVPLFNSASQSDAQDDNSRDGVSGLEDGSILHTLVLLLEFLLCLAITSQSVSIVNIMLTITHY